MTNQFVAEAESRHQASFFEPKNSTKGSHKEDAFNSSERDHVFRKAGSGSITPFESPLRLVLDARHHFDPTRCRWFFLPGSLTYVSIRSEYILLWIFLTVI